MKLIKMKLIVGNAKITTAIEASIYKLIKSKTHIGVGDRGLGAAALSGGKICKNQPKSGIKSAECRGEFSQAMDSLIGQPP